SAPANVRTRRSGGEPPTPYSAPTGPRAALNIQIFQIVVSPVPGQDSATRRTKSPAASASATVVREGDNSRLVYAPVPVVRATARVDVELAAHAVDLPLQVPVLQLRDRMHARALEEQIRDEEAAEMCRVGDAARIAERRHERDRAHDRDEHFRRDREHEVHVDRPIREV